MSLSVVWNRCLTGTRRYLDYLGKRPLFRSFLKLNFGALLAKATGFVRQPLLLAYLGPAGADYLLTSDRVGQLLTLLFIAGTLYNAALPQLVLAGQKSRGELHRVVSWLLLLLTLILTIASLLLLWRLDWLLTHWVKAEFLSEMSFGEQGKFYVATRLLLLSPFLFTYQNLFRAYLSTRHRYNSAALAGPLANLIVIGSILLSNGDYLRVVYGLLAGFCVSTGAILYESLAAGFRLRFDGLAGSKEYLVEFAKNALPRTLIIEPLAVAALILVAFVDFAGQITAFEIWTSIVTAFAFLSTSYLTVIFPRLATYHSLDHREQRALIKESFAKLLRLGYVQIPLSILGGLGVFFLYDAVFGLEFKGYLSQLLLLGIPSIVCGLFRGYFQQLLFALEDNFVLVVSLLTNGVLVLTTYVLTRSGTDAGVAIVGGLDLCSILCVWLSYRYLRTRYRMRFT